MRTGGEEMLTRLGGESGREPREQQREKRECRAVERIA